MIKEIKFFIALLFSGLCLSTSAQSLTPTVRAMLDRDSITIGDRFTLTIEVEKDLVQSIYFPAFKVGPQEGDEAQFGTLECLEDHPTDTLEHKGRRLHLRKRYTLTAFDEGVYNLGRPSVLYADKNIIDTLYGVKDSMRLVVSPVALDTTMMVRAIKPVKTLPFRFGEISGYMGIGLRLQYTCLPATLPRGVRRLQTSSSLSRQFQHISLLLPPLRSSRTRSSGRIINIRSTTLP